MLKAFQTELNRMAEGNKEGFTHIIQKRMGDRFSEKIVTDMEEFITLLPTVEKRIFSLYTLLPSHSRLKDVGSYFLTYMYQPDDYIPEDEINGLFGYLDDAYLAALFYELMIEELERDQFFNLRNKDRELLHHIIGLRRKAKSVIPDEAIRIKEMIAAIFLGESEPYDDLLKMEDPAA